MSSESPPLSGDKPPLLRSNSSCAKHEMKKSFPLLWADSFHEVNIGKTTRICKVNMNEISYKHRNEEMRNK